MTQLSNNQKIQELRKRTGAGIVDCKKALDASNYNINQAIEWLKEHGIAKAAKKGGAIAAEGVVAIKRNKHVVVLYEINSQTDFVAKNSDFINLVDKIGDILLKNDFDNIDEALVLNDKNGVSISNLTLEATAIIGEKIILRRAFKLKAIENEIIGTYVHNNKIGALVTIVGGNEEVAKQVAMHVASMNPEYLDQSSVPKSKIDQFNQEIYNSPALNNKPQNIQDNIAKGMLNKKLSEITLVNQQFVIDQSLTVKAFLAKHHAKAINMHRYELAEGITKKASDFASEVAEQISKANEED